MTASAVSMVLLATACGSDKSDTKADAKPSEAAATSAAPAAKGKTDAELAKLLVTQADLADHTFKESTPAEAAAGATATSDKPECKVLVQAQAFVPAGTPSGTARTKAIATPKPAAGTSPEEAAKAVAGALGSTATTVTLASYEAKGAEEAFAAVKTASTKCAGGYAATQDGETTKITKVTPGAAVTGGDESLPLTVELDADGKKLTTQLVLVRKGNTVATFSSLSLAGTAEQPKVLVEAQAKKLG
ncbi:hypothetical protein NRK68_20370 [Streptomyces yangpuensis]|uniref:Lipoprotein n=1 Tax=Streptomyces yangpuensis TaxID=1648182 RepID=A0ABY5PZI2_9ACTN|nr:MULTISPECIES: hypothetical protein [Streptomyces]MBZ9597557.1 hypothetical protein [Streptomyces erythrochromogenes]UUY49360.1 hypothetical protein NRK68_20370 [Streptomyces yangpuensis]